MRISFNFLICITLISGNIHAQLNITSSGVCAFDTLRVGNIDSQATKIEWKKDGTVVATYSKILDTVGATVAGTGIAGNGANHLQYPVGVCTDGAGNIYIADDGNSRIQKWAPGAATGTTMTLNPVNGMPVSANGIFIDAAGNLYIADGPNHRVVRYLQGSSTGMVVAGGNGTGSAANQLASPGDIFVDGNGNLYVADRGNSRVQKWAPGASSGTTVAGGNGFGFNNNQVAEPSGVFVNASGTVYVSDQFTHRVYRWNAGATTGVRVAGNTSPTFGTGANFLYYPGGIYVDSLANVFVADIVNNRIQKWASGATTGITVAGGHAQGLSNIQFDNPLDIGFDLSGNLYVCDYGNHRIQKFNGFFVNKELIPRANGVFTATASGSIAINTSNSITLYAHPSVAISSSNGSYICQGNTTTLSVPANPAATYQWTLNGNAIANGTGTQLPVNTEGSYKVSASANGCTNSSLGYFVKVATPPSVTITSANNCLGTTLQISSSDTAITKIEWKKNGVTVATAARNLLTTAITIAGGNNVGSGSHQFNSPQGFVFDGNGNIYIADLGNHRIQKWAPGATSGTTIAGGNGLGPASNQLSNPNDVWFDNNMNLYIADGNNHRVQKWADGASTGITVAGGNGSGAATNQLQTPNGIRVDEDSTIYITNSGISGTGRIVMWKEGALVGKTIAGNNGSGSAANQLSSPYRMHMDRSGTIYLSDLNNIRVQKWERGALNGETVAGGNGSGSGSNQLQSPRGVFVDDLGNVYVSNFSGHRISKWAPGASSGVIVAGTGSSGSTPDKLNSPNHVYVSPAGDLYVTDANNNRIQKFPSSINKSFTPASPGVYSVIVTIKGGCEILVDSIVIHEYPDSSILSSNGNVICSGSSTVLSVKDSSGYSYQWQLNNNNITNANGFSHVADSAGTYKVLITGLGGCVTPSKSISLSVIQRPTATIVPADSLKICMGSTSFLQANTGSNLTYKWYKNGLALDSTRSSLVVSSVGQYNVAVTRLNTCTDTSLQVKVIVNPLPQAFIVQPATTIFCQGVSNTLQANTGAGYNYQWTKNDTILPAANNSSYITSAQGYYRVIVTDSNGCKKTSDSIQLNFYPDPFSETICAVTVDSASGKNMLLWQKTSGVRTQAYKIYRETAVTNQYSNIGTVGFNVLSAWLDSSANSLQQSYSYKISTVDSCGRESALSPVHRTIHLQSNVGVSGEVNLSWSAYQGFTYTSFYILRSLGGGTYQQIGQVSGSTLSYTDLNPPSGQKKYFIEIEIAGGCAPSARNTQVVSRLKSNVAALSLGQPVVINWIGCVSTDWMNPANWQGNVIPGQNDIINISTISCFQPSIPPGVTVSCRSLQLAPSVNLNVGAGAIVNIMQ